MKKSRQRDDIKTILRKNGLKATSARIALLALLERTAAPLSAQALIERLGDQIDQATVYRALQSLKERHIIRQVDLRHNHAHYERTTGEEHHHLVCLRCGTIEDVHQCNIDHMHHTVLAHAKNFARIEQHALEFYGICKRCAKTEQR